MKTPKNGLTFITIAEKILQTSLEKLKAKYPGIELKKSDSGWEVIIPEKYKVGHEAHFALVTKNYLQYLDAGKLPEWEVPNMIAKYYTTTQALLKASVMQQKSH